MSGQHVDADEPFWVPRDPSSGAPERGERRETPGGFAEPHPASEAGEPADAQTAAAPPRRRVRRLPPLRPGPESAPVVPVWVDEDDDDLVGGVGHPVVRPGERVDPPQAGDAADGSWAVSASDEAEGDDLLDLVRAAVVQEAATQPLDLLDLVQADAGVDAPSAGVFDIEAVEPGSGFGGDGASADDPWWVAGDLAPTSRAQVSGGSHPSDDVADRGRPPGLGAPLDAVDPAVATVTFTSPGESAPQAEPWGGEPGTEWDDDAAVEGEGWALEGDTPEELAWAQTDTSPVPPSEMTGLWLRTETGRESPVRMDGQPVDVRDLDIRAELQDRLRDWADLWEREWDPAQGWRPRARIGDYEALGRWLARAVKDEMGAIDVTLELAHLGRSGVERIAPAEHREPTIVVLRNQPGVAMPVWGDFVTDSGVGSFSSEINLRLEAWAEDYAWALDHPGLLEHGHERATYEQRAHDLAAEMQAELGPDYRVRLELPELT